MTVAAIDTTTFQQRLVASSPEHYGQRVTFIGEEGDVLVLGHPGRRRSIAAANRLARKVMGLRNLADDLGVLVDDVEAVEKWAVPGHGENCDLVAARHRWAADPNSCQHNEPPVIQLGDEIKPDQNCDCDINGDGEWWIRYVAEGTPGAFPVTKVGF